MTFFEQKDRPNPVRPDDRDLLKVKAPSDSGISPRDTFSDGRKLADLRNAAVSLDRPLLSESSMAGTQHGKIKVELTANAIQARVDKDEQLTHMAPKLGRETAAAIAGNFDLSKISLPPWGKFLTTDPSKTPTEVTEAILTHASQGLTEVTGAIEQIAAMERSSGMAGRLRAETRMIGSLSQTGRPVKSTGATVAADSIGALNNGLKGIT